MVGLDAPRTMWRISDRAPGVICSPALNPPLIHWCSVGAPARSPPASEGHGLAGQRLRARRRNGPVPGFCDVDRVRRLDPDDRAVGATHGGRCVRRYGAPAPSPCSVSPSRTFTNIGTVLNLCTNSLPDHADMRGDFAKRRRVLQVIPMGGEVKRTSRAAVAFVVVGVFVACDPPFAPDDYEEAERYGFTPAPSGPSCNTDTPWTGSPIHHMRFHCSLACELRGRQAHAEADWTCLELDVIMRSNGRRANEVCFAGCPENSYDHAQDPRG